MSATRKKSSAGPAGAKRTTSKGSRQKNEPRTKRHEETINTVWNKVQPELKKVYEAIGNTGKGGKGVTKKEYVMLLVLVHDFCISGSTRALTMPESPQHVSQQSSQLGAVLVGREIYDKTIEFLEGICNEVRKDGKECRGESMLDFYTSRWTNYIVSSQTTHNVLGYLNRHWVKREIEEGSNTIYEVFRLSLVVWFESVFAPLKQQVIDAVMELITRERNGEPIKNRLIHEVVRSLVELGTNNEEEVAETKLAVYIDHFETRFLMMTEEYYKQESAKILEENPVTEYMKKAIERLEQEKDRVTLYLDESTGTKLNKTCEQVLIKDHSASLESEFNVLLENQRTEDLRRMYLLLQRIDGGLKPLSDKLNEHVILQGKAAVEKIAAEADAKSYVDVLLSVHHKYNELVKQAFDNDPLFVAAMEKACRDFVNHNAVTGSSKGSSKSPELVAQYCDSLLKKSSKNPEEEELERLMQDIMVVFKFIEEKDVFEKFYSKRLAKRLVYGLSASDDAESQMISLLKAACGTEYTSKLQKMFNDVGLSKDLHAKFKDFIDSSPDRKLNMDFNVMVLTNGFWPFMSGPDFILPVQLNRTFELFTTFYGAQHQGRKLNWLFHISKGELKAVMSKGTHIFKASTHQMAVLLSFNSGGGKSIRDVCDATNLKEEKVKGIMKILSGKRLRVLKEQDELFYVNEGFRSKNVRINIDVQVKSEEKKESDQTHKHIEEDRMVLIQATIVRIMKMRKQLKHQVLLTEAISQLSQRFQPKVSQIKKNIDTLIDKEYLRRVEGARDEYAYVA